MHQFSSLNVLQENIALKIDCEQSRRSRLRYRKRTNDIYCQKVHRIKNLFCNEKHQLAIKYDVSLETRVHEGRD